MAHCLQRNSIGIYRNLSWLKTLLHCVIYSVKIYFPVRMILFLRKRNSQIPYVTNFRDIVTVERYARNIGWIKTKALSSWWNNNVHKPSVFRMFFTIATTSGASSHRISVVVWWIYDYVEGMPQWSTMGKWYDVFNCKIGGL